MTILKTIVAGFMLAGMLNLIWDLQDFNYWLGTITGIFLVFSLLAIVAKSK